MSRPTTVGAMAAEVQAAIASPATTEVERWVLRWQYRRMLALGSFTDALLDAATRADNENLGRIGEGWPALAHAIRCWRDVPGFADQMREKFPFMD